MMKFLRVDKKTRKGAQSAVLHALGDVQGSVEKK